MIMDANLQLSNAQAITSTAPSTGTIDLTGVGSGNAPKLNFGNATTYGADLGIGDGDAILKLAINVTTAFATSNGATLNIQFQGAPDNGSNMPGTWTTYSETGAIAASALVANGKIPMFWDQVMLGATLPRFIRLNYTVGTGTFSAGALNANIVVNRDDNIVGQYPAGFSVA